MTATKDLESISAALNLELARAEARVHKVDREKMVSELAGLERERAKVVRPLRKIAKETRAARVKTELLLKSQYQAEHEAAQELTRRTDYFDARIEQIRLQLRYAS